MFFAFSKVIWALISPLNFIFLLTALGVVFLRVAGRASFFLFSLAFFLFAVTGLLPVGINLLISLENRYERPALAGPVEGIIVLGGTFETDLSLARGQPVLNDNAERVLEGVRLARLYPQARLVFSGGEGRLIRKDRPESNDAKVFLRSLGFDPEKALYEEKSRNTWENALFTHEMVRPAPGERWIVVTSAWHMPRAMAAFRAAGWSSPIPWPVDYRTDGDRRWLPRNFDVAGNIYKTDLALHEYVGWLAYRLDKKAQ